MTFRHKWLLFKLRTKLNLTYMKYGFTHVFSFDQDDWNVMLKKVDKDILKYWRIKHKLEGRK